jgi:hypothetical protein
MTQLLSLFNQVFGIQPKSKDLETFSYFESYFGSIKQGLNDLLEAWVEARSEQSKYYNKHCHIE